MKRLLTILPILSLLVTSCYNEPFADVLITPNPAWVGEDVLFNNISSNADYVEWNMGDGSTYSSFNVEHFYFDPGSYNVTLRAFGKKGDMSRASFIVDVDGSELKIVVKEVIDEYAIEEASVVLFATLDDWYDADYDKAVDEQFTNRYGACYFENLSYQKYYVDVYYQVGNEGYINWLLGEDDPIKWVETQQLPGGWDHTFIAYVEYVTFDPVKKSADRSGIRPPREEVKRSIQSTPSERPVRENKSSVKTDRK